MISLGALANHLSFTNGFLTAQHQCQKQKLTIQMGNWSKGQIKVVFSRAACKKENTCTHFGEQLLFILVELMPYCKISPSELLQFLLSP